jgi:peptidoglycan/LPS O-acetylase OafA/YrhL
VHFFFSLSGFLFTWLYARRIAEGKVTLRTFAVLRLSRLYPLHLATLLLVAGLQAAWLMQFDDYFVYRLNDWYHFALNVGMISGLGMAMGLSFNGPAWSISIEVFLYAVFFALTVLRFTRWWHQLLLVVVGIGLLHAGAGPMSIGLVAYFMGSIAYLAFARVAERGISFTVLVVAAALAAAGWATVVIGLNAGWLVLHSEELRRSFPGTLAGVSLELIVFPLTLFAIAVGEAWRGTLGKRFAVVGAISYSCYLLHFPLQIVFMAAHRSINIDTGNAFFYSPWSLLLFFGILLPLSLWVNRHLERPSQAYLRARLLRRHSGTLLADSPVQRGLPD